MRNNLEMWETYKRKINTPERAKNRIERIERNDMFLDRNVLYHNNVIST